jgi:hypothetical protein
MLCTLWPTQHIPVYWKQRWLIPLPKAAEPTNIEDLQSICLLEIFRKPWTSILTHRIRNAWEHFDMLDPSQHRFRAKHGTDSASLLLVDALKHAKDTHFTCLVSFWDIRRAFDSISKPASFLIQLDTEGTTSVRLPVSQFAHDKAGQASTHWAQLTSYSQLNEVSHKVMSPVYSDGTLYMTSYSEPSPSNVATSWTLRHKQSHTLMTFSLSAAPLPAYNNKLT